VLLSILVISVPPLNLSSYVHIKSDLSIRPTRLVTLSALTQQNYTRLNLGSIGIKVAPPLLRLRSSLLRLYSSLLRADQACSTSDQAGLELLMLLVRAP
jgi:hypothetical protein